MTISEPQVSLLDVVNKWFAVLIQARYSRAAVKHKRPLASRVPMQLALDALRNLPILGSETGALQILGNVANFSRSEARR
jgi:hypothetical protein